MDWDVFFVFFGIALLCAAVVAGIVAFALFDDDQPRFGLIATGVCIVLVVATCLSWAASDSPEPYGCENQYGESVPC